MIHYSDRPLLRGMDIRMRRVHPKNLEGEELAQWTMEYEFWIHHPFDLLHFEIMPEYIEQMQDALGWKLRLFVGIPRPEYQSLFFYFAPIGWWIIFWRVVRKVWMAPAMALYRAGYIKHREGEFLPLFWFVRLRFRSRSRTGE